MNGSPFVFQIAAALKKYELEADKKGIDFSIGTPPTSPSIRAQQMKILLGKGLPGQTLAKEFENIVACMGRYELAGGSPEIRNSLATHYDLAKKGLAVCIISGGLKKAKSLWAALKKDFSEIKNECILKRLNDLRVVKKNEAFIVSNALLKRLSLAFFIGPDKAVSALSALHANISGTPSTPQENLFLLFQKKNPLFKKFLRGLPGKLQQSFGRQFSICTFGKIFKQAGAKIAAGNGGGRQALHTIESFLIKKGIKKMLLFKPHWTYHQVYPEMELIALSTQTDGQPDFEELEQKLAELTKKEPLSLTLNSPNNPSGTVYTQKSLQKILKLCEKYGVYIVDDACYINLLRKSEKNRASLFETAYKMVKKGQLSRHFLKKIFIALTVSKVLGMAGARLGAIVYFDHNFAPQAKKYQTSEMPNSMALFLADKLTKNARAYKRLFQTINEEIDQRVATVTKILDKHRMTYKKPAGAFYIELATPFLKGRDMKTFAMQMAQKGLAFMPMEVFGGNPCAIRLSLGGEKDLAQLEKETEILISTLMKSYENLHQNRG
jgi:aspartate/methionine/tyrosine aminotransferase